MLKIKPERKRERKRQTVILTVQQDDYTCKHGKIV